MSKDASGFSSAIFIPQHLVSLSLEAMHHLMDATERLISLYC